MKANLILKTDKTVRKIQTLLPLLIIIQPMVFGVIIIRRQGAPAR